MDASAWAAWAGVGLAFLSLLLHWLRSGRANEIQEEQLEIQRRLKDLEMAAEEERREAQQRADLRIECPTASRLEIVNVGQGTARDVTIDMECPGGKSPFLAGFEEEHLPIPEIEPFGGYGFTVAFRMGCAPPLDAELAWIDEDGEQREKTVRVTT